jgi:hypothetical protein
MSKKPPSQRARRKSSDDKLSPKEWQARYDAAITIVARKYCDMFKFWRDCRYKPCRSARRCVGDARDCLHQRQFSVPYDVSIAARERMSADTPPNADRFVRTAYHQPPHSAGKPNSKLREARAMHEAENQTKAQRGAHSAR